MLNDVHVGATEVHWREARVAASRARTRACSMGTPAFNALCRVEWYALECTFF